MNESNESKMSDFPKIKLSFLGAVGTVTGSCTMLDYITKDEKGTKVDFEVVASPKVNTPDKNGGFGNNNGRAADVKVIE